MFDSGSVEHPSGALFLFKGLPALRRLLQLSYCEHAFKIRVWLCLEAHATLGIRSWVAERLRVHILLDVLGHCNLVPELKN